MIELDKSSDDLLKNESLIDLDADTAAFSMQSSRASTTFTQFFTQFGGSNDLRAYVADRSRIKELITLDSENSKKALKSYLNIYTTLHSGLEELRDLPAGPAREQRLTELMARTTTRACSDKGLDLEGTRALCNLLTHGEYQLEDFRRNQADFRQGSDLIRSIGAGIAAGSATLLPPSGVLLPLLAGFLADRGINSLAEDACLTLKRPRDSCSKHCLKSSAPSKPLQAQRINLRGEWLLRLLIIRLFCNLLDSQP